MFSLVLLFVSLYLACIVNLRVKNSHPSAEVFSYVALIIWLCSLLCYGEGMLSWQRLIFSCVFTLYLIKVCIIKNVQQLKDAGFIRSVLYCFIWPGMDIESFTIRAQPCDTDGTLYVKGHVSMLIGIALFLSVAFLYQELPAVLVAIFGTMSLFLIVHFGYALVLTALIRMLEVPVRPLFSDPLSSQSIADFWSHRWNLAFVDMNKRLVIPVFPESLGKSYVIFGVFLVSGLLHELGISYPAGKGWGLPTLYFIIQGVYFLVERHINLRNHSMIVRRMLTWIVILLPLPLLFHEHFISALIFPLFQYSNLFLLSFTVKEYFSVIILLAGLGHFVVLIAGLQVPTRLNWSEDLRKLIPFNRKIMWNYGFFILMIIIAFGIETLMLRKEFLAGSPAALGLAVLIGGFWMLRLLVDCFYFNHEDWPSGPEFVIGHTLLNSLFIFFVLTYGSLIVWHCWV